MVRLLGHIRHVPLEEKKVVRSVNRLPAVDGRAELVKVRPELAPADGGWFAVEPGMLAHAHGRIRIVVCQREQVSSLVRFKRVEREDRRTDEGIVVAPEESRFVASVLHDGDGRLETRRPLVSLFGEREAQLSTPEPSIFPHPHIIQKSRERGHAPDRHLYSPSRRT